MPLTGTTGETDLRIDGDVVAACAENAWTAEPRTDDPLDMLMQPRTIDRRRRAGRATVLDGTVEHHREEDAFDDHVLAADIDREPAMRLGIGDGLNVRRRGAVRRCL